MKGASKMSDNNTKLTLTVAPPPRLWLAPSRFSKSLLAPQLPQDAHMPISEARRQLGLPNQEAPTRLFLTVRKK